MPNGNLQRLNGDSSRRRVAPIGVGVAWFLLLEGIGVIIKSTGHPVDQPFWGGFSGAIGMAASLISRSHTLRLAGRLVVLRFLFFAGLLSKEGYLDLRDAAEETFEADISPKA